MIPEKANELLAAQALLGGYNRNSAKPKLADVQREHEQDTMESLINALELERIFGFKPGTVLS